MDPALLGVSIRGIIAESPASVVFAGQTVECGRVTSRKGSQQAVTGLNPSERFQLYSMVNDWPDTPPAKGDIVVISGARYRIMGANPSLNNTVMRWDVGAEYESGNDFKPGAVR